MAIDLVAGARATRSGFQIIESVLAGVGRLNRNRRQVRRAVELLGIRDSEMFNYRVAMQHPDHPRGAPHPDDGYAFVSVASEAASRAMERRNFAVTDSIPATLDEGFVLIGSPESELLTSAAFGYTRRDDGLGMKFTGDVLDLPYRWEEDQTNVAATCTRYVPGRDLVTRPNWPIIDNTGTRIRTIAPVVRNDGMLASDFLLITRLPNFLSDIGLQSGRSLISIGGTHGTGTRAIDVLLRDRTALRKIADEVPMGTGAFQILLEAGVIDHNRHNGSVATKVQIRDIRSLERPNWMWDRARSAALAKLQPLDPI